MNVPDHLILKLIKEIKDFKKEKDILQMEKHNLRAEWTNFKMLYENTMHDSMKLREQFEHLLKSLRQQRDQKINVDYQHPIDHPNYPPRY